MYRQKTKRDTNHLEIAKRLVEEGYSVIDLAAVGSGVPDILVGITGRNTGNRFNILMEIKKEKTGRLQENQEKFIATWHGQTTVVRSVAEALYVCDCYRLL